MSMNKAAWITVSNVIFFVMVAGWLVFTVAHFAKANNRLKTVIKYACYMLTLACVVAGVMPVFNSARLTASRQQSRGHVQAVDLASFMYGDNYDQRFPLASNWKEALQPYWRGSGALSDANPTTGREHWLEFNQNLTGASHLDLLKPDKTVMFAGGVGKPEGDEAMVTVGYCNGRAWSVKQEKFSWGTRETIFGKESEKEL